MPCVYCNLHANKLPELTIKPQASSQYFQSTDEQNSDLSKQQKRIRIAPTDYRNCQSESLPSRPVSVKNQPHVVPNECVNAPQNNTEYTAQCAYRSNALTPT